MAKDVIMPKFGFTQETAELLRWLKQPGDFVEQGDPIAEVTTDKVDMEVEAPASGVLADLRFKAGDVVPVTAVIAVIRERGEEDRGQRTGDGEQRTEDGGRRTEDRAQTEDRGRVTPVAARLAQDHGVETSALGGTGLGGRVTRRDVEAFLATRPLQETTGAAGAAPTPDKVRAVPAARKLALELGVDLANVAGSGPRGRIQSSDVLATHAERAAQAEPAAPAEVTSLAPPAGLPTSTPALPPGVMRVIPLVGMRRTIAQRLQQSYQQAPHITFDVDVDVTAAEALRRHTNTGLARRGAPPWSPTQPSPTQPSPESSPHASLTAVLVRACAWALHRHPLLNSRLVGESIEVLADIHIGVAVALEDGLIVPVVRDAGRKGILQIASELSDLAARARSGSLRPDDVSGGTFTISNLGMFGVDRFTAILNPPQSGILAVGQVRRKFVPDEQDRPVVRPLMALRLSADHRVVDGAVAARFLSDLRAAMEQPGLMSL